jgi:glycosyltransferase involved in cell wall biosynthesis
LQTDKVRAFYRHIDQEKIRIIPNPLKEIDREEKAEEKFILAAGRLVPQKGMDLLIKAFGKSQAREKWNLVILGEGQELSNLQKLVRENKLNEKVEFKGNRKDIDKFFATASVFVLSSRYEGFPNVLAEAMGAGLPCISFDCDFGPRELIEHQRNGILVETGNVDKLAEKIDELASNKGKRNTMGEEAKKIREKLNMNAIMQQWEEVFAEMVNQKVNG